MKKKQKSLPKNDGPASLAVTAGSALVTPIEAQALNALAEAQHLRELLSKSLELHAQYLSWTRHGGSPFVNETRRHVKKCLPYAPDTDERVFARVGLHKPNS